MNPKNGNIFFQVNCNSEKIWKIGSLFFIASPEDKFKDTYKLGLIK